MYGRGKNRDDVFYNGACRRTCIDSENTYVSATAVLYFVLRNGKELVIVKNLMHCSNRETLKIHSTLYHSKHSRGGGARQRLYYFGRGSPLVSPSGPALEACIDVETQSAML